MKLSNLLDKNHIIALDTMIFIYHFKNDEKFANLTNRILNRIESGKIKGVTTILTVSELMVKPLKDNNFDAAEDYKLSLNSFPNLEILDIDQKIANIAAGLRAKYNIKMPDALQIAGALSKNATLFITNDKKLKKVSEIEVVVLGDLV